MINQPYDTKFLNELHAAITFELTKLRTDLGSGTQVVANDASATGMAYARYVGRIFGLETALELILQINDDMNGKNRNKKEDRTA